jgi:hypothetical protein
MGNDGAGFFSVSALDYLTKSRRDSFVSRRVRVRSRVNFGLGKIEIKPLRELCRWILFVASLEGLEDLK